MCDVAAEPQAKKVATATDRHHLRGTATHATYNGVNPIAVTSDGDIDVA